MAVGLLLEERQVELGERQSAVVQGPHARRGERRTVAQIAVAPFVALAVLDAAGSRLAAVQPG